MKTRRLSLIAALLASCVSLVSAPVLANNGNGNGNGGGNGHGNSGNHGNKPDKSDKGQGSKPANAKGKNAGKPDRVERDISYDSARRLAVSYGLTGYKPLPPGIAKNLVRGKPLPPGIAKKAVPAGMLSQLPYYPGYEWQMVGKDLVLIALSTALVTAVINNVFD